MSVTHLHILSCALKLSVLAGKYRRLADVELIHFWGDCDFDWLTRLKVSVWHDWCMIDMWIWILIGSIHQVILAFIRAISSGVREWPPLTSQKVDLCRWLWCKWQCQTLVWVGLNSVCEDCRSWKLWSKYTKIQPVKAVDLGDPQWNQEIPSLHWIWVKFHPVFTPGNLVCVLC